MGAPRHYVVPAAPAVLDKKTASEGGVLAKQAKRLLQKHANRNGDPKQHIKAPHSGYLLSQETYFVGTIKSVGNVYMAQAQTTEA